MIYLSFETNRGSPLCAPHEKETDTVISVFLDSVYQLVSKLKATAISHLHIYS